MVRQDSETNLPVYTYNIDGSPVVTTFDSKAYNIVADHNSRNDKALPVSNFALAYGGCRDVWTTDQIAIGISGITYATDHRRVVEYVRPPSATYYRFRVDNFDPTPKMSTLRPFFDGATRGLTYIPMSTRGNTQHGVDTRIKDVRPKNLPDHLSRYQDRNITAFLNEYKKDVGHHRVNLLSNEEVCARQNKPSQRLTNAEALTTTPSAWAKLVAKTGKVTQSFQKNEAGMKPGDPRNITPMPPVVRLQNSRISLALASNMKKTRWYAFGKTPDHVSAAVAEHVSDIRTKNIGLGDYSRMDGTINRLVRKFDLAFLYSNFHERDHPEILLWYEHTYNNKVKAQHGVGYDQEESQASGDPYTSALNTARNAFICFCCLLASGVPGSDAKLSEAGAYENIGLCAGDDSLQRNLDAAASAKAAASWGFVLKIVVALPGDQIDFLARQYSPAVWHGSPANICSPLRTISKFHVSTLTGVIPSAVIANMKAKSILANDSKTLIIGSWMRKIVDQTDIETEAWTKCATSTKLALLSDQRMWNDKWASMSISPSSYQLHNDDITDWQHAIFLREFEPEDINEFVKYLDDPTTRWDQCPTIKSKAAIPAATPYFGNGELVNPASSPPSKPAEPAPIPEQCVVKRNEPCPEAPRLCARGDKNTGWYEGMQPCTQTVTGTFPFCRDCHKIYVAARKAARSE